MSRKHSSIGLSILVLAGIIIGMAFWIKVFYTSIQNYRSPLQEAGLLPQTAPPAQTTSVVMVLISGLGYDDSLALNLPVFEQLKQAGATAAIQSNPPTYSQTAWGTIITGAPSETNDAPPADLLLEELRPLEIDTIFARAHDADLTKAIFGTAEWGRLVSSNQLNHTFFANDTGPIADRAIFEAALPIIETNNTNLVLLHFTQVDFAARLQGGTSSEAYRQAALTVDNYLGQLTTAMDLSHSVLVVLSDHGHIAKGGHGGNEVEVIWQPLVMIGQNIIPGNYSDIDQTDIAPTITTLLGLPSPTATQGRILFEMLQLTEEEQTIAQLSLAQQRVTLAEAYLAQIQGAEVSSPDQLTIDLTQAQTALTNNNVSGAFQLATFAQEEADTQIVLARHNRLKTEQTFRLVVAGLIMLVWFITIWRRRGFHAGSIAIAAVLTVILYHTLYQIQGYNYTLSSIRSFETLPIDIARRTAVSLLVGGGLVLILLMLTKEDNWLTLLGTGYGYGMLVTFIFSLPLFWAFWQNGFVITWHLPEVVPAFWQITVLFEVLAAAILALLLPWPIMMLNLFVSLIRHYLSDARSQKSDALPGLHL
jgi:hypothetical protein